jgi:tetratricopeptide (TPR) repeat protein
MRADGVREAARIADSLGDPALAFTAADALKDLYEVAGDYGAARREIEAALPLLSKLDAPAPGAPAYFEAGTALLDFAGDARRALQFGEQSRNLARERSPHEQMHATSLLMTAAFRLGEWDLVEEYLAEHLANLELESQVRCLNVQRGPSDGALVVAHRGDPERARHLAGLATPFERLPGPIEGARADALVAAGSIDEGLAIAMEVLKVAPRWRGRSAARAAIHGLEARGDWDALGTLARDLDDLRGAAPYLDALLERARGRARVAAGDLVGGIGLLRSAIAQFDRLGAVYEAAQSRERLADVAPGPEVRSLLDDALAVYARLRAAPHVTRVEQRLAGL